MTLSSELVHKPSFPVSSVPVVLMCNISNTVPSLVFFNRRHAVILNLWPFYLCGLFSQVWTQQSHLGMDQNGQSVTKWVNPSAVWLTWEHNSTLNWLIYTKEPINKRFTYKVHIQSYRSPHARYFLLWREMENSPKGNVSISLIWTKQGIIQYVRKRLFVMLRISLVRLTQ